MNLTTGELRQELGRDLQKNLQAVVDRPNLAKLKDYYILVVSKFDSFNANMIKTTIQIHNDNPEVNLGVKPLGTMCYYINNEFEIAKRLWVLPLDIPHVNLHDMETSGVNKVIAESAQNAPIIY